MLFRSETIKYTAHIRILPYASLFICLGGIVSTAEAMYHGVPLLVPSHGFKEIEWQGENIDRLGIGIHLRQTDTTPENIRRISSEMMTDSALFERVRRAQHEVLRDLGPEETVNRIEDFMEQH